MQDELRHSRTGYDPKQGIQSIETGEPTEIDAASSFPSKSGAERYRLSTRLLGHLERLAQATFLTRKLLAEDFERWQEVDEQSELIQMQPYVGMQGLEQQGIIQPLAQSVYCSSAIEGEEIVRRDVEVAIVGQAHVFDASEPEARNRAVAVHDIYVAYVWALSRPFPLAGGADVVMTPKFILDIHRLMFQRTKPNVAGEYKRTNNKIVRPDSTVLATMLPHEKVSEFVQSLCDRVNAAFLQALHHGSVSKLLSVGEFVCDFLAIHPFADGNGRLARLLSTYLLDRAEYLFARFYSLDAIILERHHDYYRALMAAQKNFYSPSEDLTPWITFYLDCVFNQWLRAYQHIKSAGPRNGGGAG